MAVWICPKCGLPNLPSHAVCYHCSQLPEHRVTTLRWGNWDKALWRKITLGTLLGLIVVTGALVWSKSGTMAVKSGTNSRAEESQPLYGGRMQPEILPPTAQAAPQPAAQPGLKVAYMRQPIGTLPPVAFQAQQSTSQAAPPVDPAESALLQTIEAAVKNVHECDDWAGQYESQEEALRSEIEYAKARGDSVSSIQQMHLALAALLDKHASLLLQKLNLLTVNYQAKLQLAMHYKTSRRSDAVRLLNEVARVSVGRTGITGTAGNG